MQQYINLTGTQMYPISQDHSNLIFRQLATETLNIAGPQ